MVSLRRNNTHYRVWLVAFCCLIGVESTAQMADRSPDLHIIIGAHSGFAVMLAPFEYTASRFELRQPVPKPGQSFYNFFAGVAFSNNEILFSYGDLPMACGFALYDANRGVTYRASGLVALNSFFALSYKRKLWTGNIALLGRQKKWSVYAGGYVGMANNHPGLGGLVSSFKRISSPDNTVEFEARSKSLIDRKVVSYFVSFGPVVQLRFHASKLFKTFVNMELRITPHVVQAYRVWYNLHQRPDDIFRTTDVRSRVINLHVSVGILFDIRLGKHAVALPQKLHKSTAL